MPDLNPPDPGGPLRRTSPAAVVIVFALAMTACVLGVVVGLVVANRADADVSKAWDAAKDNVPANTQFVLAVDVAALQKSPAFPMVFEMIKAEDRGLARAYDAAVTLRRARGEM